MSNTHPLFRFLTKVRWLSTVAGVIGGLLPLAAPNIARSATPPEASLVLHLKLDGDTLDSSEIGNHGELLGEPEFVTDSPLTNSMAISLTANNMGVTIPGSDSLAANIFTLCYWVKPTTLQEGAGLERLTSRSGDQFETAIGNAAAVGGAPDLTLSYYQGTWNRTTAALGLNEWSHVTWRNRGPGPQNLDLFVNGKLVYTGVGVPESRPGSGLMNIGTRHNGLEGFEGLMDDVRLYGDVLEDADIAIIATPSDTDGDGLPDSWEIQNNLSPTDNGSINVANGAAGDPDSDGLTNAQEFANHANPNVADTDGDGLNDGVEITRGTRPTVADTDIDGLTDGDEVARGTNPLVADTDGDTIPDGVEVDVGTNPLDPLSGPDPVKFLILHLKLDGDTQDSSTLGNNGELLNEPEFVADTPLSEGTALSFTANNMGVTIPASDSLAANPFTLCYWVKPTTLQEGAGLERLTSRSGDQFETAIGNASAVGGAPDLTLSYYQGTWNRTTAALSLNEWSHVAWRNRGSGPQDMDLFVNGRLLFTGVGVGIGKPGAGLMNIGTRHNGSEGFEGLMDDIRLYRAPLRPSDIAALGGFPIIVKVERAANGASLKLTFTSLPARVYAVEHSADLEEGSWIALIDNLTATGTETSFNDTTAANLAHTFYRIRQISP